MHDGQETITAVKSNWEWYIDKSNDGGASDHRNTVVFVVVVAACSCCLYLYQRAVQKRAILINKAEVEAKPKPEPEAALPMAQCLTRSAYA